MLLGLWIYWYVTNYIIFKHAGDKLSPQIVYDGTNIFALVGGIILLVAISFAMSLIFRHLNVQLKLTDLYDNFISNITHELKSPLSSIQLYLETMDTRDVPREKQKEFIALMMKDVSRLKTLINSILEMPALERKKIAHNYELYLADSVFRKLFDEAAEQFAIAEGSLVVDGEAMCKCVIDRSAMKIVINNLIDNAVKYSPEHVKIAGSMKCDEKKLTIDIKDNGIGMHPGELKKIFNKFHRIYNANIPNVKGTGLGLYWVREIIKSHGGQISAFSAGEGKGTTFRIELPVYQKSGRHSLNKLLKYHSGEVRSTEVHNGK
jgi:signal transduction histidine kinase